MREFTAYGLITAISIAIFTTLFEYGMSFEFANALYTLAGYGLLIFGGIAAKILLTNK